MLNFKLVEVKGKEDENQGVKIKTVEEACALLNLISQTESSIPRKVFLILLIFFSFSFPSWFFQFIISNVRENFRGYAEYMKYAPPSFMHYYRSLFFPL